MHPRTRNNSKLLAITLSLVIDAGSCGANSQLVVLAQTGFWQVTHYRATSSLRILVAQPGVRLGSNNNIRG
jgi:hypothetical protein